MSMLHVLATAASLANALSLSHMNIILSDTDFDVIESLHVSHNMYYISFMSIKTLRESHCLEKVVDETDSVLNVIPPDVSKSIFQSSRDGRPFRKSKWLIPTGLKLPMTLHFDTEIYMYHMMNQSLIEISEIYAIKNGDRIVSDVTLFDLSSLTMIPLASMDVWNRRTSLFGEVLVNTIVDFAPFHYFSLTDQLMTGLLVDILNSLAQALNFKVIHKMTPDGEFGVLKENKTWTGMVGVLARNEADISCALLTDSLSRRKVIDFTLPLYQGPQTIIKKRHVHGNINLNSFLKVYNPLAWVVILGCMILACLVLWKINATQRLNRTNLNQFTLIDSIALVLISFMQLDFSHWRCRQPDEPTETFLPFRISYITTVFLGFFLYSFYTSDLTSTMISKPKPEPIKSLQGLLESDIDYNLYVDPTTSMYDYFAQAKSMSIQMRIYEKYFRNNPYSYVSTIEQQHDVLTNDPKALIFEEAILYEGNSEFKILTNLQERIITNIAFGLVKDSEFRKAINRQLLLMKQSGVIAVNFRRWQQNKQPNQNCMLEVSSLGLDSLAFPFGLMILGGFFGISTYIIEKCYLKILNLRSSKSVWK